jgi:hypothetical protein
MLGNERRLRPSRLAFLPWYNGGRVDAGPSSGFTRRFMGDATQILSAIDQGDENAASQLLPLV